MIETINGKAYVKVGDKVYEVGGSASDGIEVESAQVGQTIVVKAVDENGKPTEWEAVDLPESTDIITANSVDELPDPASVPEGTVAFVASEESGSGSGGTTIHYYDSLEAAEAANLPDGAFVAVPSEGVKEIDLDAYGIDILTLANAGGGSANYDDIDHEEFWRSIPLNGCCQFSAGFYGDKIKSTPYVVVVTDYDMIVSICFTVLVTSGATMTRVSVKLTSGIQDSSIYNMTQARVVVEILGA